MISFKSLFFPVIQTQNLNPLLQDAPSFSLCPGFLEESCFAAPLLNIGLLFLVCFLFDSPSSSFSRRDPPLPFVDFFFLYHWYRGSSWVASPNRNPIEGLSESVRCPILFSLSLPALMSFRSGSPVLSCPRKFRRGAVCGRKPSELTRFIDTFVS